MTAYSASLGLPRAMIWCVAGLLREHRRTLGTRKGTRILTSFRQAVFILAWMRDGGDIERLGAGFGLSRATPTDATARRSTFSPNKPRRWPKSWPKPSTTDCPTSYWTAPSCRSTESRRPRPR